MKSKKSDQLTKQFNDAASLKSKWNNEYKVRYAVAAGETDKVKQIEFIQLNKFDPDELDKQMMGVKTQFRALEIIKKVLRGLFCFNNVL
jgi:hypothetical protein